jgi:hypothetical protein
MRCHLLASIILALLVVALGAGCDGERVSIEPRDEPTVVQTQRDGENEPAGALTLDPPGEAGAMNATPTPEATDIELPAGAEALVTLAQQDLARRLDLASDVIRAASVEAAEWPDASLGCPQPGEMYAQVITPGFRIVLEAQGVSYEYHADSERRVICCEPQQVRPVPGSGPTEMVDLARADLAQRLGVSLETISVSAVLGQEFSPDAFSCQTTKERAAREESPAVVVGTVILLDAAGRRYEYHASDQTVIFCRKLR